VLNSNKYIGLRAAVSNGTKHNLDFGRKRARKHSAYSNKRDWTVLISSVQDILRPKFEIHSPICPSGKLLLLSRFLLCSRIEDGQARGGKGLSMKTEGLCLEAHDKLLFLHADPKIGHVFSIFMWQAGSSGSQSDKPILSNSHHPSFETRIFCRGVVNNKQHEVIWYFSCW
jgi:hypothetical protein